MNFFRNKFFMLCLLLFFVAKVNALTDNKVKNSQQLPDSAVYEGEYKNHLLHGQGRLSWRNGETYAGMFQRGLMHGRGRHVLPGVFEYEGEFVDGLWQGQGKLIYPGGDRYEGEFKDGLFHGQGRFTADDGTVYTGSFRRGEQNGEGKIVFSDNGEYTGQIRDWKMHGKGVYKTAGNVYAGQFVNNVQQGSGEIKYNNGDHYRGEIIAWAADGYGELTMADKGSYKGEFKANSYHGKGTLIYKNGDKYIGEFANGARHGLGRFIRSNPRGRKKELKGWWEYDSYVGEKKPSSDILSTLMKKVSKWQHKKLDAEALFYRQPQLLEAALAGLRASDPKRHDMYFVGFAAYGGQDVFMKETTYAQKFFDEKLATQGRSISLVNNDKVTQETPLATVTNLERVLQRLARLMDPQQDILFLYLTSHGSQRKGLNVSLQHLPLNDLAPDKLVRLIKQSGIKWKVIVVSACYSGGFVEALKDESTLVMTSASADHVSFGCSDEAEFTYFGRALFTRGIPETPTFFQAFSLARMLVTRWEKDAGYDHSEPQFWQAPPIIAQLQKWRNELSRNKTVH